MIYVVDQSGQLICVSREAGQVYWIVDLNKGVVAKKRPLWSAPVLASDRIVVVASSGELRALDPKDGKLVRSLNLKVKNAGALAPVPVGGELLIASNDAEVIAVK